MKKIRLLLAIAVVLTIGCDNPFWSNGTNKQPIIDNPPIEYTYNDEAALMGMAYYDLFTAPDSIAQRIYDDIALIDSQYFEVLENISNLLGENTSQLTSTSNFIQYSPFWTPSYIGFTFDSATVNSIADSTHDRFYYILDSLGALSFNIKYSSFSNIPYGSLYLNGLKNPLLALSAFDNISEIINIYPGTITFDRSLLLPYFEDENAKYFYMFRYGDCFAGCAYSITYYFEIENNMVKLNGEHNSAIDSITPAWIDTVIVSYNMWRDID